MGVLTKAWRLVGTHKEAIALPLPEPSPISSVWSWLSLLLGVVGGEQAGKEWSGGMMLLVGGGLLSLGAGLVLLTTTAAMGGVGGGAGRKGD